MRASHTRTGSLRLFGPHRRVRVALAAAVCTVAGACGPDVPPYWFYPPGPCASDADCVVSSFCIEPAPGSCLVPCRSNLDCAPPYACRPQKRRGAKGDMDVCSTP